MTLTIKNGHVLLEGKLERKNIVIENGKISGIGNGSSGETINAEGKVILPGLIDAHVHLREPGMTQKEDIKTGTMAAAAGGVTTVLEMPNTNPATTTLELLEEKRELFRQKAVVNYGLYMGATASNLEEIKKAKNAAGVKIYMGSSTGDLLVTEEEAIRKVFGSGKNIVVHAEDEEIMKRNTEKHRAENDAYVHSKIRGSEAETAAVRKAIEIAATIEMKRLHFTHVSSGSSLEAIKAAKGSISCDATPHHLFLTAEELKKHGNFAKMNPSLKSSKDAEALWQGINDGTVGCIATDHAPHTKEEKELSYWEAPSGVPGLETMLPLLLDAVNKKRLTLQKVAELTAANPANLFNIKSKGNAAVGGDADLVIVDMNMEKEVRNEELFTKCKWSPFNGWKLKGWPVMTIVNGEIVFEQGEISGKSGKEAEFE